MPKVVNKRAVRQTSMDFFLVSPKNQSSHKHDCNANDLRQVTLHSLSRVVSVDHMNRCRDLLKDARTEKVVMLATLEELGEKIPSQEVLKTTKIGHVIRKLLKHSDEDIAKAARYIYNKWKTFFVDQATKTTIDVKCSSSTENCRKNARKHLAQTLQLEENHPTVVQFEKEAFHLCKTKTLHQYKRIMRCIILKSRTDDELRQAVLGNKKSTKEIVTMFE